MSQPSAEETRAELSRIGVERTRAKGKERKSTNELAKWLKAAVESPDVSLNEAVKLAGTYKSVAKWLLKEEK
jgi:hypothetical protein